MATPSTREELKQYCLRKLGSPVIRINVADEQLEDSIDDALELFFEFHFDGQLEQFIIHELTQDEIDLGRILVNDNVYSVQSVYVVNSQSNSSSVGPTSSDMQVQSFFTQVMTKALGTSGGSSSGVSSFYTMNAKMAEVKQAFKMYSLDTFNLARGAVYIYNNMNAKAGDVVILHSFLRTTPEEFPKVWNNIWLKKYTTQLFRLQWYTNLSKYSNVQLIGGVTLDVQGQIREVNEDLEKLKEQLRYDYEEPVMFFMG